MDRAGANRSSARALFFVLAGGLLVAVVLVVGQQLSAPRTARANAPAAAVESAREPVLLAAPPDEARVAALVEPRALNEVAPTGDVPADLPTAREYLARYYGGEWPETELKLEAAGVQLDQPYQPSRWEDVEAEFESRIGLRSEERRSFVREQTRWPEQLTQEFLKETFPLPAPLALDEKDVKAIESLVAGKNGEIQELAEYYGGLIDHFVHESWDTGDYLRAPFATAGLSDQRGFHTQSHAGRGWAVTITLSREKFPEAAEVEKRMLGLCQERNELVAGYVRTRFGR